MSQTSSGPPTEAYSPESPPLHEQGIIQDDTPNTDMDTTASVSKEDLANNDFLLRNPASKRVSEPTLEHYLFFEELLKKRRHSWTKFTSTPVLHIMCAPQHGKMLPYGSRNAVSASAPSALTQEFQPLSYHQKELIEMRKAKRPGDLSQRSRNLHPTPIHRGDPCCHH
ncbi:hypothetical protein CDAR_251061 [Caerostris darwini]|uniref:Uncharacterized protein n=1 Tax=Caerostris darwini TaxID=1538125 RepID=A0AAV4R629_9ARAC|nr:hypothetical protein CDAR_251061 [Caerostris darwini]